MQKIVVVDMKVKQRLELLGGRKDYFRLFFNFWSSNSLC